MPTLGISVQAPCERSKSDHREIRVGPNSAVGKYSKPMASRRCSAATSFCLPRPTAHEKSEAIKRAMEKAATGPSEILIYHPTRQFAFGKLLGVEFGTEVLEAILIVFLLSQTRIESFAGRVGFVLVTGILAAISTNVPYWNWYGFPSNYTAAYIFIQIVAFFCTGVIAALVLAKQRA